MNKRCFIVINQKTKEGLYTIALMIGGLIAFVGFIFTFFAYWLGGTIQQWLIAIVPLIIGVLILGAIATVYWHDIERRRYEARVIRFELCLGLGVKFIPSSSVFHDLSSFESIFAHYTHNK